MSEREQRALATVRRYMWWAGGAGLIPIPFVDLIAVSGVQLKMLADISKIYDIPFKRTRVKAAVGALIGFVVPNALAFGAVGCAIKAVPGVGTLAGAPAMALFSAAAAWAIGRVFIQHFESGGTFLDFDPDKVKEYFREQFEEGRRMAAARPEERAEGPA